MQKKILLILKLLWPVLKKLNLGRLVKSKNPKQLITEPLDPKKTVFFVQEHLDPLKITNVYVENIKE